ncbi:MAG: hypothetical protein HRT67_03015 [Flavobacteriaceae bacterium]|nr:hypothetical protein [Flavobacteriaceae bacterium]
MFSEQSFDLLLNFGEDWKVEDVKVDFKMDEIDIFVRYIGSKAECLESMKFLVYMTIGSLVDGGI